MSNIKVLGDLELSGSLAFSANYSDFPSNPVPRTVIVKDGVPYIYTELVNGSGFFSWQPIGIKQASYLHSQGVASTVWTVTHNFNTTEFAYFVYDTSHNLVMANIEIVDANTVKIHFTSAITGTAVLFSLQYLNSTTVSASQQLNLNGSTLNAFNGVLTINNNDIAFKEYVDTSDSALSTRIDNLIANTDPAALDSLSEILSAFQNADSDINTTISNLADSTSANIAIETTRAMSAESALQVSLDAVISQASLTAGDLLATQGAIDGLATIATTGSFTDLVNVPTTLSGYGITDAYTKSSMDSSLALKADISSLASVATSGSYSDLSGVPVNVSSFTNDAGYQNSSEVSSAISSAISNKADKATTLAGYGITDAVKVSDNSVPLSNGSLASGSYTSSTTNAGQIIDSISSTDYRSAKWLIQITSGSSYMSTEILAIHDGINAYISEVNTVMTGDYLATFDAGISGGNLQLLTTPTNAVTSYKVIRTGIYS